MNLLSYGMTDTGQVRPTNQDAVYYNDGMRLYIVADGMGGHAGGEVASQLCIDTIAGYISHYLPTTSNILALLETAINEASCRVFDKSLENPDLRGMGTTATVCFIKNGNAYFGHVGDSRLYLLRCGCLYQISEDHSFVHEQLRMGLITQEEADVHQLKNVITRSVGYQEFEDVDVDFFRLQPHDRILLCSDGLHGFVSDHAIFGGLQGGEPMEQVQKLVNLANESGGMDNVSAVVLEVQSI